MKTKFKYLFITVFIAQLFFFCTAAYAAKESKNINVVFNGINIQVNGTNVNADNILYNGTTYAPLRKVAELCNKEVAWDAATNTANLIDKEGSVVGITDVVYVTTEYGEKPELPSSVKAVYSNGSIKNVNVKWDTVDTQTPGEKVVRGTISGSDVKAIAVVTVNEKKASISKIEDINVAIDQDSDYTLPKKVSASFDDGTKNDVEVVWDTDQVDTSKTGTFVIEGTVKGYSSKVKLNLTINPVRKLLTVKDISKYSKSVVYIEALTKSNIVIGSGSGFIVSSDGKVVTNFHVIDDADKIKVVQEDGTELEVEGIFNYNEKADIAVLKVKGTDFTPLILGDSSAVEIADSVVAIGNPQNYKNTVSTGIISGLDRDNNRGQTDIQFTASVTHGSSGGALFNMYGEVIGITYAGYNTGDLNFAIPINEVKPYIESGELKTVEEVTYAKPAAPTNVWARATTYGSIKLGWDEVYGADYYNIYWSTTPDGNYTKLYQKAYWYKDYCADITDLPVNATRYYKITAVRNGVESDFSEVVFATTKITPPTDIKYFPELPTVPMVQGADYVKVDYSTDNIYVSYFYEDTIDVEEYEYMLQYLGFRIVAFDTETFEVYYMKGTTLIVIGYYDKYFVIMGEKSNY